MPREWIDVEERLKEHWKKQDEGKMKTYEERQRARIEELEDVLRVILMIPNSPAAQGIMKVAAKAALKEY